MTTRELSKHIYEYVQTVSEKKRIDTDSVNDINEINYISHLMTLHFEPDNHLGSKGFVSLPSDIQNRNFGC
jgi:hypothetical protein